MKKHHTWCPKEKGKKKKNFLREPLFSSLSHMKYDGILRRHRDSFNYGRRMDHAGEVSHNVCTATMTPISEEPDFWPMIQL